MKKLLLLAAIAATLAGCSYEAFDRLYYTDFTRYANNGVFVSSISDYAGSSYVALGDIAVQSFDSSGFDFKTADPQEMLDKVVVLAKKKGANGVIGYSARYSPGGKERGYWYATGVAVHFESMPVVPHVETVPVALPTFGIEDKAKLAKRTVDYLMENDIRFVGWSARDGDLCFDISTKTHIPYGEFDKLYGENIRRAIEVMEKDARKAKKKAARNK